MDISKIYRQAWELTKKYKVLWFFGAILIMFTGGGGSFNIPSSGGGSSSSPTPTPGVDNVATSSAGVLAKYPDLQRELGFLGQMVGNWLSQVSVGTWFLLGLGLVVAIVIGIVIGYVARAWALGSLISGIDDALDGKELTVTSISQKGFKSIKSIIWLLVVPGLLLGCYIFVLVLVGLVLFAIANLAGNVVSTVFIVLISLTAIPLFFVPMVAVSAILIFATRIAILEGLSGKESFLSGWKMVKKNFSDMFVLGLVNQFVGAGVGCLTLIVLGLLGGLVLLVYLANHTIGILVGLLIFLIFILFVSVSIFLWGAYTTFNYTTWNILYKQIKDKEN